MPEITPPLTTMYFMTAAGERAHAHAPKKLCHVDSLLSLALAASSASGFDTLLALCDIVVEGEARAKHDSRDQAFDDAEGTASDFAVALGALALARAVAGNNVDKHNEQMRKHDTKVVPQNEHDRVVNEDRLALEQVQHRRYGNAKADPVENKRLDLLAVVHLGQCHGFAVGGSDEQIQGEGKYRDGEELERAVSGYLHVSPCPHGRRGRHEHRCHTHRTDNGANRSDNKLGTRTRSAAGVSLAERQCTRERVERNVYDWVGSTSANQLSKSTDSRNSDTTDQERVVGLAGLNKREGEDGTESGRDLQEGLVSINAQLCRTQANKAPQR